MAREAGGTYEDTEGLINLPLTVKEIQAVVFFKQTEGDEYRVSMRSKGDIDIGAVAKEFGGGGHKNAAGCTVSGADRRASEDVRRADRAGDRRGVRISASLDRVRDPGHRTQHGRSARSSTSRSVRPRTTSSRASGARSASAASAIPARSIRWRAACCRSSSAARRGWRVFSARRRRATRRSSGSGSRPTRTMPPDSRSALRTTVRCPTAPPSSARWTTFRGTFLQQPPAFSAKKIGGIRSYALARQQRGASERSAAMPVPATGERLRERAGASRRCEGCDVALSADLLGRVLRAVAGARPRRSARDGRAPGGAAADASGDLRDRGRHRRSTTIASDAQAAAAALVPMGRMLTTLPAVVLSDEGVRRARHGRDAGPGRLAARRRAGAVPGGCHPPARSVGRPGRRRASRIALQVFCIPSLS